MQKQLAMQQNKIQCLIGGAIYEDVAKFGVVLYEAFKPLIVAQKLGEVQYVYWDYINNDFIELIIASKNIDELLYKLNETNDCKTVEFAISSCNEHILVSPYIPLFTQTIIAYREEKYDLAVLGLLSIVDGLLTDVSEDDTTNISKRTEAIMKRAENNELLDDDEISLIMLSLTFQKTVEILSAKSNFSGSEPENLNRHWIMHGRSRRRKTKLDCIKLINFIYGILLINNYAEQEVNDNE
jgi:hypothetical protein